MLLWWPLPQADGRCTVCGGIGRQSRSMSTRRLTLACLDIDQLDPKNQVVTSLLDAPHLSQTMATGRQRAPSMLNRTTNHGIPGTLTALEPGFAI
jgi:hypothetical protein